MPLAHATNKSMFYILL